MSDDLVAFLRARYAEEAALAFADEGWTTQDEAEGMRRVDVNHSIERVVACTLSWRAEHIAHHDPARVLRDVTAKRALLKQYEGLVDGMHDDRSGEWAFEAVIRSMAAVYSDHPDYRLDWTP